MKVFFCTVIPPIALFFSGAIAGIALTERDGLLYATASLLFLTFCVLIYTRALSFHFRHGFDTGFKHGWKCKDFCNRIVDDLTDENYIKAPKPYNPHEYDK